VDTPTPTPAADAASPDLSLDQIIASELQAADAAGAPVVKEDTKASTEAIPPDPAPAGEPPAEEKPPVEAPAPDADEPAPAADEVTARRVRTMLAKLEEREKALAERESQGSESLLSELLKSPKALLAKYGKSIDDVIDASLAEGKDPPAATADDNPRLTALERRIEERERAEKQAAVDQAIANRKAEIHREISGSTKYPVINEAKRHGLVTDYMIEFNAVHGKPISWDRAAAAIEKDLTGLGIAVAKKLGWSAPAAAAPAAAPSKDRPGTQTIAGSQRDTAPSQGDEPEDPEQLMKFLVAQAGL